MLTICFLLGFGLASVAWYLIGVMFFRDQSHKITALEQSRDCLTEIAAQHAAQRDDIQKRFDDLVARDAKDLQSPIRVANAVEADGVWSVHALLRSGATQLIARFDTPDAEYNRILAQDLCDKLNEKPV
ncbi:MAG: hypothetical protein LIO91_03565 [Bacteroidales bacterium]|nr:hypothetical protein [Bacteroidales bacterium]